MLGRGTDGGAVIIRRWEVIDLRESKEIKGNHRMRFITLRGAQSYIRFMRNTGLPSLGFHWKIIDRTTVEP